MIQYSERKYIIYTTNQLLIHLITYTMSFIHNSQYSIRYPTVSSTAAESGAYDECAQYLISQLKSVPCLESVVILDESVDKCPVVIGKWEGIHPDCPVIILNSHYDVVPAVENDWNVAKPFAAERKDGKVSEHNTLISCCVFKICTILSVNLTFFTLY